MSSSLSASILSQRARHILVPRNVPCQQIQQFNDIENLYYVGTRLGQGSFGTVDMVIEKANNKKWAMKTVQKAMAGENLILVKREIDLLKRIKHPHIIYLDKFFESKKSFIMILELCHEELSVIFNEKGRLSEKCCRYLIKQLAEAVVYLHKHDIVHRDIKMGNILLGENPNDATDKYFLKLTDFGLSTLKFGVGLERMLHDKCGTTAYMAPEFFTKESYSQECDIWSIGVILFALLYGRFPFTGTKDEDLISEICRNEPDYNDDKVTEEAKNLLKKLLLIDTSQRLTAHEILKDTWICERKTTNNHTNILNMMKEWKKELATA